MKKGGLLNELEERIDRLKNFLLHYECKIGRIENDNSQLNCEYVQSFNVNINTNDPNLINYRQSIIDQISLNNNYIYELKNNLIGLQDNMSFLQRMYWFLNK